MRNAPWFHLERYRLTGMGEPGTRHGAFRIPCGNNNFLHVIVSDGPDWEHVSATTPFRCPTWAEMCRLKDLFWAENEVVMQLHPPKSDYVNLHPYCLHLWRPINDTIPLPPLAYV